MKRNRPQTEQRIIDAAISLIVDAGFTEFGVNHVSARAGVDKVLIYRYFGGVEGLLEHIGRHTALFPEPHKIIHAGIAEFIESYRLALTEHRLTSVLLDWHRLTDNPLIQAFRRQRRTFWDEVRDQMRPDLETNCLLEIIAELPINAFSSETVMPLLKMLGQASQETQPTAIPAPEESAEESDLPTNLL